MTVLPQVVTARLCANSQFALTSVESVTAVTAAPYRGAVTANTSTLPPEVLPQAKNPDATIPALRSLGNLADARPGDRQEQWQTAYKLPILARGLTPRQSRFVELVVSGASNAHAYRCAYRKPVGLLSNRDAANGAYRVAKAPAVKAHLAEIQSRSQRAELLTINERLSLLAGIARDRHSKPMDRIRAIDVYTRIAGDGAPGRVETCGPVGAPAVSELQNENLSLEEKIERLQAAKRADQGTTTATREAGPTVTQ